MVKFSVFFFLHLLLLLLLLLGFHENGGVVIAQNTDFDFGTLGLSGLKLLGDAHLKNGSVHLTRDLSVPNSSSGRLLYSKPITFRRPGLRFPISFSTYFTFSVTNLNPSSVGGGLAFIISPDDQTIGESGGFLGLKGSTFPSGDGFVGVEFDTLMDVEFKDINGNHVGFDLNSLISTHVGDLGTIQVDLKSGDLVNVWIDYDGMTRIFNVSVSYSNLRPINPFLSFHVDLYRFVKDVMFVGFSASTQGSTEIHSIEWWSFSSSFTGVPLPLPGAGTPPPSPTATFVNQTQTHPSSAPSGSISETQNPENTTKSSSSPSSSCHGQLCRRKSAVVAGVVAAGVFFLVILACFLIWVFSKRFKYFKKSDTLTSEIIKTPKEFSYKDLKTATNCFNPAKIIGHGAFGTVYKGIFPETGALIAVKRCRHSTGQGKAEFLSELAIIGTLRHRNLVRLQGWCHEKGEILLVYDFMPNGSLDKALFEAKTTLPWFHRRKILMGVASALAYLHQECENQVIHRDIKASNIMLDEYFNARLGDFGLAKQTEHDKSPDATVAAGTMGYLAPEYLLTGRASEKTDVFSFGAVILEVSCGRRPIEKDSNRNGVVGVSSNLVEWVWSLHREGRLLGAADSRLGNEFDEKDMMRILLVGLACSHPDPVIRPSMRNVVQMLLGEADVPIVPRTKPSMHFSTTHLLLSLQDSVSDCNEQIAISTTSSSDSSFTGGGSGSGDGGKS